MIKKYFRCSLLSDVIFNASLATQGNIKTLDYIPGSIFLGLVAGAGKYNSFSTGDAYNIFHSDKVAFGDACISIDNFQSYAMPYTLFQDKLKKDITSDNVWVNPEQNSTLSNIRWEQHRDGYFNSNNNYVKKTEQKFSLKSAQDRTKRRSREGAMFGFESLQKGQNFIFSIDFETEKYVEEITRILTDGIQRIGKSKTAQYGQVNIELIPTPEIFHNGKSNGSQLTVYAESNLCFLNNYGQATFQPCAEDFGVKGKINWPLTKIRTHSYSSWNSHRNTTNTQRDCLLRGSVIVFDLDNEVNIETLPLKVGEYKGEGLGRVIYNPSFLGFDNNGLWSIQLTTPAKMESDKTTTVLTSNLSVFLKKQAINSELEVDIGKAIQKFIKEKEVIFAKISSSQWGVIRSEAIQAKDNDRLIDRLFSDNSGVLMKGVAAEMYWDKNNGKARNTLKEAIEQGRDLGTKFTAKLATEMAKRSQKKEAHEVYA